MEKSNIATEYKGFVDIAEELAKRDIEQYPLGKNENPRSRFQRHLVGMMAMYDARYGNPEQRTQIVNYVESQLFANPPQEDEVCHLTYAMWQALKETILNNEIQA